VCELQEIGEPVFDPGDFEKRTVSPRIPPVSSEAGAAGRYDAD
jgi:hypothetical protein